MKEVFKELAEKASEVTGIVCTCITICFFFFTIKSCTLEESKIAAEKERARYEAGVLIKPAQPAQEVLIEKKHD